MQIGVPKEIKNHEYRVGLPPAGVVELVKYGHEVLVEMGAGDGAGFDDLAYSAAGATLVDSPSTIFQSADLIVKVKEPQPDECKPIGYSCPCPLTNIPASARRDQSYRIVRLPRAHSARCVCEVF